MEYIFKYSSAYNKRYKNKINGEFYRITEMSEHVNPRQTFLTLTNENDSNIKDIMIGDSTAFLNTYDLVDDNGVPLIDYSYKHYTLPNGTDTLPIFICNKTNENRNKINELIDKVNELTSKVYELESKLKEEQIEIKDIPGFEGTMEMLDKLNIRGEENE